MPAKTGKELGANVLPFGLTTDVSAAALTASAGGMAAGGLGLQGAGQATRQAAGAAAGAKMSGFAIELTAAAGTSGGQAVGEGAPAVDLSGATEAQNLRLQIRTAVLDVASGTVTPMPEGLPVQGGNLSSAGKLAGPSAQQGEPVEMGETQSGTPADAGLIAFTEVPGVAQLPIAGALGIDAGVASMPGAAQENGAVPGNILPAGAASPASLSGPGAGATPQPAGAGAGGEPGAGAGANGSQMPGSMPQTQRAGSETSGEQLSSADAFRQVPAGKDRRWQSELPQELRAQTYVPARAAAAVPAAGQPAAESSLLPNGKSLPAAASDRAASVIAAVTPGTGTGSGTGTVTGTATGKPAELMPQEPFQAAMTTPAASAQAGTAAALAVPSGQPIAPTSTAQAGATLREPKSGAKAADIVVPGASAGAAVQASAVQASAETAVQVQNGVRGQADALPAPLQPDDQLAASAGGSGETGEASLAAAFKGDPERAGQSALQRIGVETADPGQASAARPVTPASAAPAAMAAANLPDEEAEISLTRLEPGSAGEVGSATVRGGDLSGAARTESLQTPSQTQSAHVSTQVAAEIARNLKNGQTRFQMRFDPPELGRVEVHMKVNSDGSVQTHLIVDRPETLDMFLRDQRGLERALENAGLTPDSENMQFSLKQDGNGDFASGQDQSGGPAAEQGGNGAGVAEDSDQMAEDVVRLTLARQRGGLDMKV